MDIVNSINVEIKCISYSDCCTAIEELNLEAEMPDLILIDVYMPKLSGLSCLRRLQSSQLGSFAKFVVYSTSLPDARLTDEFKKAGATIFQKPNSYDKMYFLLEELLEI